MHEKNLRGIEFGIRASMCLWWHGYLRLIVIWCSDLGTLRKFLGHIRIDMEGSIGPILLKAQDLYGDHEGSKMFLRC